MDSIVKIQVWSSIDQQQYDNLVKNIKGIGQQGKDVELLIKPKTVKELGDFNAKYKSIKNRLKQDFKITVISHIKAEVKLTILTIKPEKKEIKPIVSKEPLTNPAVLLAFMGTMQKLKVVNRDQLKSMYMGLMDKHRKVTYNTKD